MQNPRMVTVEVLVSDSVVAKEGTWFEVIEAIVKAVPIPDGHYRSSIEVVAYPDDAGFKVMLKDRAGLPTLVIGSAFVPEVRD